jgi:hypothetical protein
MIPALKQVNFADLYGSASLPVLEEFFMYNVSQVPVMRDLLARVIQHDREIWQYTESHDMPQPVVVAEGEDYTLGAPKQGYDKTLSITKKGYGFSISEEAFDDGRFDMIGDAIAKLAKSSREKQEQDFMDLFNNGFSSATTADGQSIFSTAHITPTGTITISNRPATHADLSFISLSTGISDFARVFRGDSGVYQMIKPKFLLVPAQLELYAKQLVASAQEADTANNNINPFHNQLQVVASPRLSDSDAWFLLADKMDNGLRIINRKSLEFVRAGKDSGFLNDNIILKCRYRDAVAAVNHLGLYGTAGA